MRAAGDVPARACSTQPKRRRDCHGGLVCVAFDDPTTADRALTELTALQKEYLIELKDACVVVRYPDGEVHLHQAMPLVKTGALAGGSSGALWGTLIGLLFLNPLAGMALGAGLGAASGALAGKLSDTAFPTISSKSSAARSNPTRPPCSSWCRRSPLTRYCRRWQGSKAACSRRRSRMTGKAPARGVGRHGGERGLTKPSGGGRHLAGLPERYCAAGGARRSR